MNSSDIFYHKTGYGRLHRAHVNKWVYPRFTLPPTEEVVSAGAAFRFVPLPPFAAKYKTVVF